MHQTDGEFNSLDDLSLNETVIVDCLTCNEIKEIPKVLAAGRCTCGAETYFSDYK